MFLTFFNATNIILYLISKVIYLINMSNSINFEDFYQVPDLNFDINKLREELDKILKSQSTKL